MSGSWVALYSGGKDSTLAFHKAKRRGLSVDRLVTVHPTEDSYLYHVPATELAELAAESLGLPLTEVALDQAPAPDADSGAQGDAEIEPLEETLAEIDDLAGVVTGAVESEYQADRLETMCDRLDCDLYAPLWQADPETVMGDLLGAGFEVIVVAVAAEGLDADWLGRPLDELAFADLQRLADEQGVHPLGEGGEFETLVLDGPHRDRRLSIEYERSWDGTRGSLTVTDATLES